MKHKDSAAGTAGKAEANPAPSKAKVRPKLRAWQRWLFALLVLAAILGIGRAFLPWVVRDYVNRTLDRSELYQGRIGPVEIHLWRGAYSIRDLRLDKTTGNVPVPFFSAKRVDFALQWNALIHGRVVGRVLMDQPQINFVDAPSEAEKQTGAGGPWLQMIRDLFPFEINSAIVRDGSVHFRTFQGKNPVDVYLSQVEGSVDNLSNIRNETAPLISTVQATALAMDQAQLQFKLTLDPFSYRPTFHMALRLLGLDVTKVNDLALAYGKFDFKRGWFDLVLEVDSKEGQTKGYIKPLFRQLKIFSLSQDIKEDNVLQFFWQALVGAATKVLRNPPRDQVGTLIPFSVDVTGKTSTDILATLGNLLRNAFVRAYLPRLQNPADAADEGFTFEPPDISAPVTPSETQ